jgi:hypothetical protein
MTSTYEMIATTTLGSSTQTVTLSSIPATYTDLVLVCSIKGDAASMSVVFRVNGDSGSNYSATYLEGTGSSASSARVSSQTQIPLSASISYNSTNFGTQIIQAINYSNTTTNKTFIQRFNSASGGSFPGTGTSVGLWRSTSAINQLDLISTASGQNFVSGSTFTLYGIKAE